MPGSRVLSLKKKKKITLAKLAEVIWKTGNLGVGISLSICESQVKSDLLTFVSLDTG